MSIGGYLNIVAARFLQFFVAKIIIKSRNLKRHIYSQDKVVVRPNGVNFDVFRPMGKESCRLSLQLSLQKKLILFLGDPIDPNKNIALLKSALAIIDDQEMELIAPFPTSQEEVVLYLNACDVLALTSYMEGSPNVIKEAMACNCPIVATDVGDVSETLGKTDGCFLTSHDPNDVARKIHLAVNINKRTKGRDAIGGLEINTVARKLIEDYEDVLRQFAGRQFNA